MPAPKKKKAKKSILVVTGIGQFSYPHLAEPDSGRSLSDDKYKTDFFQPKETFKETSKSLIEAVKTVGRKLFEDDNLKLSEFPNPIKDTDKPRAQGGAWDKKLKGSFLIRAKSDYPPLVLDADGEPMSDADVRKIKGGDFGRLVVEVAPYTHPDPGVTVYLKAVQFARAGKPLGEGNAQLLSMLNEIEIEMEDIDPEKFDDAGDEDEAPAKKGKAAKKSKPEPEDDEELDDEDEDEKPKKKKAAKSVSDDDEDDSDGDADASEDEEADEAPKKTKKGAKPAKSKKSDEDEDEVDDLDFD